MFAKNFSKNSNLYYLGISTAKSKTGNGGNT